MVKHAVGPDSLACYFNRLLRFPFLSRNSCKTGGSGQKLVTVHGTHYGEEDAGVGYALTSGRS